MVSGIYFREVMRRGLSSPWEDSISTELSLKGKVTSCLEKNRLGRDTSSSHGRDVLGSQESSDRARRK